MIRLRGMVSNHVNLVRILQLIFHTTERTAAKCRAERDWPGASSCGSGIRKNDGTGYTPGLYDLLQGDCSGENSDGNVYGGGDKRYVGAFCESVWAGSGRPPGNLPKTYSGL